MTVSNSHRKTIPNESFNLLCCVQHKPLTASENYFFFCLNVNVCLSELLHWGKSTHTTQGICYEAEDGLAGVCECQW